MKATLALTLWLLSAGGLRAQVRSTETFNKAILEEESQHNLAAAVADYQQVVVAFDEERQTAAAALFRLAECQRKLHHDDQAKAAYLRIVREFVDQGRVVELSRSILGGTYHVTVTWPVPVTVPIDPQKEDARKRYRLSLNESLKLAEASLARIEQQVRAGLVGPEAVEDAKERILKLQRDLAAFDMGIMPDK